MVNTTSDALYLHWCEQISAAYQSQEALNISGAGSKKFYGGEPTGRTFDIQDNRGIIEYDPAELVVVARAGTPLIELQETLASKQQKLGFEPPFANRGATLGGAVATALAGSGQIFRGGVRDYILGAKIINGKGEILQFGGKVMKNVAGFDLFRPMAGAMGTLGILLEISLRLVPQDEAETTLKMMVDTPQDAIETMTAFRKALPSLTAAAWDQGTLYLRLSGTEAAIHHDQQSIKKAHKTERDTMEYWPKLAGFEHALFNHDSGEIVAAIDLPPATVPLNLKGTELIDWCGARRYLKTTLSIEGLRDIASTHGGSALLLNGGDRSQCFHPLQDNLMALHKRLKNAFDPANILNPGRLY